jgi:RNA-directed DNA polymerase
MTATSSANRILPRLVRIAELARQSPGMVFTTLFHHVDMDWMREAYRRTRKNGAVGVDGQDSQAFAADLEGNLQHLLDAAKSVTYRAPPVRRVHIPKGDGSQTRPIGIPTFGDKVLQRAVAMLLEAVYEQDFLACSHGFRPGRSAHGALDAVRDGLLSMGGAWVLEVDLRKFFDTLEHHHVRDMLGQRVRDGVVTRLIGKWLNAGVMESGAVTHPDEGTPQGGVSSPLLANLYLHLALDTWFTREVQPRLRGRSTLVRYADDVVIVFKDEHDAQKVWAVLPKRMARFGLTLHPEKTRLLWVGPERTPAGERDEEAPRIFDFLGFTVFWGRTFSGRPTVRTQTRAKSLTKALGAIRDYCRRHLHDALAEQHQSLSQKVRGHYGYFGRPGNSQALSRFLWEVRRIWRRGLSRRSAAGVLSWEHMHALEKRLALPVPRITQRRVTERVRALMSRVREIRTHGLKGGSALSPGSTTP